MRWTAKRSLFSLRGSESSPVCQSIPAPASSRSRVYSVRPSSLTPLPAFLTHFDADQRGEERAAKKEKRKKAKDERGRKGRRKGRVLIKRGGRGRRGQRESGERGGRHRVASVSATETLSPSVPSLFLQMSD